MPDATALYAMLPYTAPQGCTPRLLLYTIRRMGAHGLGDAHASNALLGHFGLSYRRPLVLTRTFMTELARAAARQIRISGCCCPRMTRAEAHLIAAVTTAQSDSESAASFLSDCLGIPRPIGALTTAQALNQAYADLGRPLG